MSASSIDEKDQVKVELKSTFSKANISDRDAILSHILFVDVNLVEVTGDVDKAIKFAVEAEDIELSDEDASKLLRKDDFFLLPVICFVYCFQFMDKVSTSSASVMGLRDYYNMKGDMYS